jgi:hypothetical protein
MQKANMQLPPLKYCPDLGPNLLSDTPGVGVQRNRASHTHARHGQGPVMSPSYIDQAYIDQDLY